MTRWRQEFLDSLNSDRIYSPAEAAEVAAWAMSFAEETRTKKIGVLELPASFDIEASSFFTSAGEKCATMYVWTFGICGRVILGRTWKEFVETVEAVALELRLSSERRLVCYVHNLDYDFQFFRKWLEWVNVFSLEERKPLYALSTSGIEFRCSLKLSGYSLETVGKNLQLFTIRKKTGDLDYSVARHSGTPLSETEKGYCVADALVVMAYIAECMIEEGTIIKIPLTKTGYVRRYVRDACFGETDEDKKEYRSFIRDLRLKPGEYAQLRRAFQGGFTHASPLWVGRIVEDVESWDFTSSYPAVMVAEKFPMGRAEVIGIRNEIQFRNNLKKFCCLFDVEFWDLEAIIPFDNYLSSSRCWEIEGETVANGRIVSAAHLKTTITEQDFMILEKTYRWKRKAVGVFRRYKKDYLPKPIVDAVLTIYARKTELKGVSDRKAEYNRLKELLNSIYGMTVTAAIREDVPYIGNMWDAERLGPEDQKPEIDMKAKIKEYNNSWSRFLFYPWGVWVTAFARRNIWTGILACGVDYCYSDTDSVKIRNAGKHRAYFERYNREITALIEKACQYHGFDPARAAPKNKKGTVKPLGVWDFDGSYSRFKTLGAKRYLVEYADDPRNDPEDVGEIRMTVAGLNKQKAIAYLRETWGQDGVFSHFSNNLDVPGEFTGKLTHTYIDREVWTEFTDYQGNTAQIHELSYIHMSPAPYSLSMSQRFMDYVRGVQQGFY